MGHFRVYTVADVLARYYRLTGNDVIFPIGWDSFGLPAENAAIDRGVLPAEWTHKNIRNMRDQLKNDMKLSFDWFREISTCNASYYKWTQWLFVKLFRAGLAYRRLAEVNWDPVDKTVLANELIDGKGRSWRSGALVEKRVMRQWYFRTLAYSKSLKDGLKEVKGQQWRDVIQMQDGWIGPNDGFVVEFDLDFHSADKEMEGERLAVFTKHPGLAAAGAINFIAVGPGSVYWRERFRQPPQTRWANGSRKLVFTNRCPSSRKMYVQPAATCHPWPEKLNISAKHLLTGTYIPLVYDSELRSNVEYEVPVELGTPDICDHHRDLSSFLDLSPPECQIEVDAKANNDQLRIKMKNSPIPEFNGLTLREANALAVDKLKGPGYRLYRCSQHRKDWLVSRQRYWAAPIPLIHCQKCGIVPVPEDELPVELPPLETSLKRGDIPLKDNAQWCHTTCPSCGSSAERETDTLDTFVDSSWYYLRFLDPHNAEELCSRTIAHKQMPVHVYVGGIEHAIRHLFYARFIAHFLHREIGLLPSREPFRRFLPVGLVLGKTFKSLTTGKFFNLDEVEKKSNDFLGRIHTYLPMFASENYNGVIHAKATDETVVESWEKMSKSKLNGVDPSEVISRHGLELTRLTMLASVGPHAARRWNEDEILRGVKNWQSRLWRLVGQLIEASTDPSTLWPSAGHSDYLVNDNNFLQNHANIIEKVHHHYSETFVLSAVIANLQKLTSLLLKHAEEPGRCVSSGIYLKAVGDLIVMLHPLAPIFTCELWFGFSHALQSAPPDALRYLHTAADWSYCLEKDVVEQPFPQRMKKRTNV